MLLHSFCAEAAQKHKTHKLTNQFSYSSSDFFIIRELRYAKRILQHSLQPIPVSSSG